jgi:hypothetical protein
MGPPYIPISGSNHIRYSRIAIEMWMEDQQIEAGAEAVS